MTIASDERIRRWAEEGGVENYDPATINPASIDLRLDKSIIEVHAGSVIDASNFGSAHQALTTQRHITLQKGQQYILQPGVFLLASSVEKVHIPDDMAGQVMVKSTVARKGMGHMYAGWIDPGFIGSITFELFSHVPVVLTPGDRICQMIMYILDEPADKPYDGKYQHQAGVTPAIDTTPQVIQRPIVNPFGSQFRTPLVDWDEVDKEWPG